MPLHKYFTFIKRDKVQTFESWKLHVIESKIWPSTSVVQVKNDKNGIPLCLQEFANKHVLLNINWYGKDVFNNSS